MTATEITRILDETHANFVLLLCHHNADPDAVCSAYAFQGLLAKHRPHITAEIGTGQGISRLSKHILEKIPITVKLQPDGQDGKDTGLLHANPTQQVGLLAE